MAAEQQGVPPDLTSVEAALGRMVYRAGNLETVMKYVGDVLATTDEEREGLAGATAGKVLTLTQTIAGRSKDVTPNSSPNSKRSRPTPGRT